MFFSSNDEETCFVKVFVPYIRPLYYYTVNFLLSSIDVLIYLLHYVYYSTFLNCLTASCASIYSILILLIGLNVSILCSKSENWGGKSLKNVLAWEPVWETFDYFSIDLATSDSKLLTSY